MKPVSLPQFEGPLDLLLALVRKDELDIAGLPIAEVTRQYLSYLREAQELDIDLGADFAYMAATLIHIKSRTLLPAAPSASGITADPREELVTELLSYESMKLASELLRRKLNDALFSWSTAPHVLEELRERESETGAPPDSMNLLQVLLLAKKALAMASTCALLPLQPDTVTIAEMEEWLLNRMAESEPGTTLEADSLFAEQPTEERKLYLFLAMLERAAARTLTLVQPAPFAPLTLRPSYSQ